MDGVTFLPEALPPDSVGMAEEAFDWSVEHPGPTASPRVEGDRATCPLSAASRTCAIPTRPVIAAYVRLLRRIAARTDRRGPVGRRRGVVYVRAGVPQGGGRKPPDAVAPGRSLPLRRRRPPGGHLDHLRPGAGRGLARIRQGVPSPDAVQHVGLQPRRRDHPDLGGLAAVARHRGRPVAAGTSSRGRSPRGTSLSSTRRCCTAGPRRTRVDAGAP